jgi:NADH-quinone oxidoreductase subunit F
MYEKVLLLEPSERGYQDLTAYRRSGGYSALTTTLKDSTPEQLIELVKEANLRGRGGAGFPTGLKWSFVPKESLADKWLLCNADEGEPGTFKDRIIMEQTPHLLLEGMILAAYAIGAAKAYIYIRGEYLIAIRRLEQEIQACHGAGLLGKNILGSGFDLEIYVHRGAGAYICGEETALIESLEGNRGQPRYKPPFPAVSGFYKGPTAVNNVETLACVPPIVQRGAGWFRSIGDAQCPGPKLYCLSGHVKRPGLYELPMGISLRELVEEHAGGTHSGEKIKAVIPGGLSAALLPESALDIAMDFDALLAAGSMLGSAGVIVMDESTDMVKVAHRIIEFFHHESCGKCTPCREGLAWVEQMLRRLVTGDGNPGDLEVIERLYGNIEGNTFCLLGDGAVMAVRGVVKNFRSEFIDRIQSAVEPREALG